MMQAASDIYLGWTKGVQEGRFLYWRQLRDMKGSIEIETMAPMGSPGTPGSAGGRWPGRTRAPGIRRDRRIPGQERCVRESMTDFSRRYADQNERDYAAFTAAVKSGRLAAVEGV